MSDLTILGAVQTYDGPCDSCGLTFEHYALLVVPIIDGESSEDKTLTVCPRCLLGWAEMVTGFKFVSQYETWLVARQTGRLRRLARGGR